jgi:hypothetical protein
MGISLQSVREFFKSIFEWFKLFFICILQRIRAIVAYPFAVPPIENTPTE